jgi:hypothetical protein
MKLSTGSRALWIYDRNRHFTSHDIWHTANVNIDHFEAASRKQNFAPGVVAWTSLAATVPVWIADVTDDDNFLRHQRLLPMVCDRRSGFGCRRRAVGIGEFFVMRSEPDDALLAMFRSAGTQIGQFIKRQRAEESLRAKSLNSLTSPI